MNGFHSVLQRAVNSIGFDDMEVWIGQDGPAMKVMAKYRDTDYSQQYLKIDLVPAVKDGDRYYVAKPNKYDTSEGAIGKWRVSFSDQEKAKIYRAGEEKRKVLKIAKAFCKKDAPLARLDSYYLKTVFLHMLDKYPGYWTDTGDYLTTFLNDLLQYLQNGNLPMYFMQSHNLIDHFVQNTVLHENITRRLQGIVRKGEDEFIRISQRL
ncbi:cyclic GMP-AMP synthase-like receptor 3 [Ptychodera flava]|uniref:cyclic GMP-AMP synthase-like receptor 3 n=1 Tax=Ptychodera flava TaxID=63121 RepID=UPI00396A8E56